MAEKPKKHKTMLTPEQLYKKNRAKAKWFKRLSPIIFWIFIGLAILFFIFMIDNSVGNMTEIISSLDGDVYNEVELEQNYQLLVDKYGEWTIIGNSGSSIFTVRFVDIRQAFFSGLMMTFLVLSIISLAVAIVVGKIVFPKLAQYYADNNQDMVNLATLETNAAVNQKKKNEKEEWF